MTRDGGAESGSRTGGPSSSSGSLIGGPAASGSSDGRPVGPSARSLSTRSGGGPAATRGGYRSTRSRRGGWSLLSRGGNGSRLISLGGGGSRLVSRYGGSDCGLPLPPPVSQSQNERCSDLRVLAGADSEPDSSAPPGADSSSPLAEGVSPVVSSVLAVPVS